MKDANVALVCPYSGIAGSRINCYVIITCGSITDSQLAYNFYYSTTTKYTYSKQNGKFFYLKCR